VKVPFIDTTDVHPALTVFYNVVHAVGKGSPNQRDDVKLVQLLLAMVYAKTGTPPKGTMTVDGICGPITKSWILKFQQDIQSTGRSILADGRADRVRNKDGVGSISNTFYTLIWLNQVAKSVDPVGWAAVPSAIPMVGVGDVPPPGIDVVPERVLLPQTTSPGGGGRTPTSPAVQSTSPK
jgi:hypothetical protein